MACSKAGHIDSTCNAATSVCVASLLTVLCASLCGRMAWHGMAWGNPPALVKALAAPDSCDALLGRSRRIAERRTE